MIAAEAGPLIISAGIIGGLAAGAVAVGLAQTVPARMALDPRRRSALWSVGVSAIGIIYGWLVTEVLDDWALLPSFLVFGAATLALALIDVDHQLIPNRLLFPALGVAGLLLAIGALATGDGAALLRGAAAAIAYFGALLIVALAARGGLGMGDVKLALLLGLFLGYVGWGRLAAGAALAVLLGGIASMLLLVSRRKGRRAKFAYGPYLVAGAWIAIIWGEQIIDWYLNS